MKIDINIFCENLYFIDNNSNFAFVIIMSDSLFFSSFHCLENNKNMLGTIDIIFGSCLKIIKVIKLLIWQSLIKNSFGMLFKLE